MPRVPSRNICLNLPACVRPLSGRGAIRTCSHNNTRKQYYQPRTTPPGPRTKTTFVFEICQSRIGDGIGSYVVIRAHFCKNFLLGKVTGKAAVDHEIIGQALQWGTALQYQQGFTCLLLADDVFPMHIGVERSREPFFRTAEHSSQISMFTDLESFLQELFCRNIYCGSICLL